MMFLKKSWKNSNNWLHWGAILLTVIAFFIPMQYRFNKFLRPLKKILISDASNLPMFFETRVFYCLSDLLILALLAYVIRVKKASLTSIFFLRSSKYLFLYFLIAFLSLTISSSKDFLLQYYRLLQLFIGSLLFFIVSSGVLDIKPKTIFRLFCYATVLSGCLQSVVALVQYFFQRPIGLKYLGELNFTAPGVNPSSFTSHDGSLCLIDHIFSPSALKLLARAYGTLSDPNILGGYLVLSLICTFYLFMTARAMKWTYALHATVLLQFLSMFITYSRSGYIGIMIGSVVFFFLLFVIIKKNTKKIVDFEDDIRPTMRRIYHLGIVIFSSFFISMTLFFHQILDRGGFLNYRHTLAQGADVERQVYQEIALHEIQKNPLVGVGFNNYTINMSLSSEKELPKELSHPVHNIFLLIASETGFFGLFMFSLFLFSSFRSMIKSTLTLEIAALTALFIAFLFLGCCGHYFLSWTSGNLMLFFVMGQIALIGRSAKSDRKFFYKKTSKVVF
jgi:hypothetical protein